MTNSNQVYFEQIYLLKEIDISISTIEAGLSILQKSQEVRRYFAFLILLSTGLERLMKIVLSLRAYQVSGSFLSNSELKGFSHRLNDLRNEIINECFTPQYIKDPSAQEDLDFLKNDELLNEMLEILADFAQRDRYIYLDGIDEPKKVGQLPENRWDKLKANISQSNETLVACLERFVRALAKVLVLTELEKDVHVYSPSLHIFLELSTNYLGQRNYEI